MKKKSIYSAEYAQFSFVEQGNRDGFLKEFNV